MIEKYTIDMLNRNSVSVKKEYVQELHGKMQSVGLPWRKAYVNSVQGREQIQKELPEIYKNAIFLIWGHTPTVDEDIT